MSVNPKNPKNPENPENPEFKNSCKKSLDSESSFTEDDSVRINLKRIKEITTLRRKLSFKIPDIRTLNLDTRNSSTQTTADEDVVKVISQFRIEKETFQDLFEKEKENNIELREKLEEFKDKTTQLSSFIKEIEEKLKNSIDSETIHVKQSQELSNKCVQYSNQLISVNKRINELNQELKKSENILNNYTESLKLFHSDTGDLKEMILSEREEKDSEIKMLNERISNMIQLYQMESSFTPNLKIEDKMVIQKLEEKITNLQQEAEKEKSISLSNLDENQNLKLELENLKKKSLSDKRELKKLVEKIDVNKEDIASYQAKVSELQGFIVKKEQELYLQDQKFKNLQGQVHAKDLIIKDQNKKYEGICLELENCKLKNDSLAHRHTSLVNFKKDLGRKDELLKTYKTRIDTLNKELSEAKRISCDTLKSETRKVLVSRAKTNEGIKLESEKKYSQIVNVLAGLLVKVQPSPQEWKNNERLRNRMTCISTKYLGKDLDSLMNKPDYPSQLLDILSQDQFETDLHAFLGDLFFVRS